MDAEQIPSPKVAIMQPYIFPYIGYLNLIQAVDTFVFYDDVNYIKGGWINRNRIMLCGRPYRFTIPVIDASQNSLIKDVRIDDLMRFSKSFLKQLRSGYRDAKHYSQGLDYVEDVLTTKADGIGDLAASSIVKFFELSGIERKFLKSSEQFPNTRDLGRVERLVYITTALRSTCYVNAIGGQTLYSKPSFRELGVNLMFIHPVIREYKQATYERFTPDLSIIDLLMHIPLSQIKDQLHSYTLV